MPATSAFGAAQSVTRPNDTTAYTANDVIGSAAGSTAALAFPAIGPAQGEVIITTARLRIDAASVPAGMTSFRLHLYAVTPPSALGDNVAWDLPAGDRASYLGYVDLGTPVDLGSTLYVETLQVNKQITMPGNSAGILYGYLVTIGGYTPAAQTAHYVELHGVAL